MSSRFRTARGHQPLHAALAVVAAITLLACGDDKHPLAIQLDPPVGVSISPPGLSVVVGDGGRLTARAYDNKGRTASVSFEWSSSDPGIATVSDGAVSAISAGTTSVTAAFGALRATATVSVIAVAGSFAFTRMTSPGPGSFSSDVLAFSMADRTMQSFRGTGKFTSIAAPAWSPDGTLLAVEVIHAFVEDHHSWDYESDLYVLDAAAPAGSPWRALTANGLSTSPSWSPDGKWIAYVQRQALWEESHIYVVDAAGGEPVRLTRAEAYYGAARWSPDGARLAFSAYSEAVGNWDVFVVNADGSGLTNVTRNSASDFDPSWSPDGARLAFASSRAASTSEFSLDVFVVDTDGSNVKRLTTLGGVGPAWSPDGRQIVFSSASALHVMNADGSSLVRLTTPPLNSWDGAPVWRR